MRWSSVAAALVACGALAVAGCGSGGDAGSGGKSDSGPIKIGLTTVLTGSLAQFGEDERNGAKMAMAEINGADGVLGRHLQLVVQDNACNPSEGANAALKLTTEAHVSAMIGAYCSSVTLAAMPLAQRQQVPLVVDVSTAPEITEKSGVGGNDWTFRINPSDETMGIGLARYLAKSGSGEIAIVAEDSDFGRGGSEALTKALQAKGIPVGKTDFVPQGTKEFSTILTRYKSNAPQAIALYIFGDDQLNFVRQAKSFGLKVPVTGRVEFFGKTLDVLKSKNFTGSTSVFPYAPEADNAANRKFVDAYRAKYNEDPAYEAATAYQAVYTLAAAIKAAGSSTPDAIREALDGLSIPTLMDGELKFDDHNQAHDNAAIMTLEDGKVTVVEQVRT
jgi:branched-chain amino acid transport system substrate-binding protein